MSGSDDLFDFDNDDFVEKDKPGPSSSKDPPPNPKSSNKRKSVTPTSDKKVGSKKKKQEDGDKEQVIRFCKDDSEDDDEEDPLIARKKWVMVESKANGIRYTKGPPTHPSHRYVNRTIETREDKPVPVWWKITKALQTEKRMSHKPEDKGDDKLRDFYLELGKEEVEEMDDEGSQQLSQVSVLTPLTPEVITVKDRKITPEIRKRAEDKIKAAGKEGLAVPGTNYQVVFKEPDTSKGGRFYRPWGLFSVGVVSGMHWICTSDPNCIGREGTKMEEHPKCNLHKGGRVGFVIGEFTDSGNKKNEVILHTIASFTYMDGDDQGKEENAKSAMNIQSIRNGSSTWITYKKERESMDKPTPELFEIKDRRRYFDNEDDLMKIYAARQTTTLFRMMLWPDTSTKIICLNSMINFPNGAYKELLDEMNSYGLELRIHDKIHPKIAKDMIFGPELEIPFLLNAEPGESLGSLLNRGNGLCLQDKVKPGEKEDKDKDKPEKVAALYYVSSPYVIYGGQALRYTVHNNVANTSDPVVDYKNNKGDHPDPKLVPIGIVSSEERYNWEFVIHVCALIVSLLGLPNCINPEEYTAQSHPLCINRQTNSTYLDKKSWGLIHSYIMKNFCVDVYLGRKVEATL